LDTGQWLGIVRDGAYQSLGMVSFGKEVSQQDVSDIRAYVIFRANETVQQEKAKAAK